MYVPPHPQCKAECCLALLIPGAVVSISHSGVIQDDYELGGGLLHEVLNEEETEDRARFEVQWSEAGPTGPRDIFYQEAHERFYAGRRAAAASAAGGELADAVPLPPGHAAEAAQHHHAQGRAVVGEHTAPPPRPRGDAWNPSRQPLPSSDDSICELEEETPAFQHHHHAQGPDMGEHTAPPPRPKGDAWNPRSQPLPSSDDSVCALEEETPASTSQQITRSVIMPEAPAVTAASSGDSTIDLVSSGNEEEEIMELTSIIYPPADADLLLSTSAEYIEMEFD